MAKDNFPKLILETESVTLLKFPDPYTEDEIKNIFLDAHLKSFYDFLAKSIVNYNFISPHYFRIKIQVHAQERDN